MFQHTKIALLLLSAAACAFAQDGRRPVAFNAGSAAVIDEPGTYVLTRDIISRTGTALMITASGVTLDLNGRMISGPGDQSGNGIVIMNATGVTLTNGNVADFAFGITVMNSNNVMLRELNVRGRGLAPLAGSPPETGVMIMQSKNVTVEGNNFYNTGLGIFVRGGRSWGNRIANNNITAATNGVLGICYNPTPTDPMGPRGDVISGNHMAGYNKGIQMGATSAYNIIRNNTAVYLDKEIENNNTSNVVEGNLGAKIP